MSHKICAIFNMLLGALLVILKSPIKLFLFLKENFKKILFVISIIIGALFSLALVATFPSGMLIGSGIFFIFSFYEPNTFSDFRVLLLKAIIELRYKIVLMFISYYVIFFLLYKNLFYPVMDSDLFASFYICNLLSSCLIMIILITCMILQDMGITNIIKKNYEENLRICKLKDKK